MDKVINFLGTDGLLHIVCSSFIAAVLGVFLPVHIAALVTLGVGILKELVWDLAMKRGTAQWKDVLCDVIGILIGII